MRNHTIDNVAVVGAGTIGLGWAALFAAHGRTVRLTDPRPDLEQSLTDALPMLAVSLDTTAQDLRSRIEVTPSLREAVREADLVQENGPERLEFKQELFADIAAAAPTGAILASSSSGIIASAIAGTLPDEAAARMLIAHPFNPPHVVPLVEIVPGERTSEQTVATAMDFYRSLDRTPVRLHKEIEGFAANRLQSAVLQESFRLVSQGVVTAEELDTVMKASLGGRWATVGPFESYHLGGGPGGIRHMIEHLGKGLNPEDDPSGITQEG
ncbi:MAG TPA: 3-hydroxyacyl-CoA dehydrogenase NAD-binding domain-containing protein, partial [Streptomyces sp.]|nr:3-hydroxyacyl-CoA dehydrogenase NAD-binding domain-containing protein [Streptomyces sp.]